MKKNDKGFTLIEILVVIIVIGILASVSALSLNTLNSTSAKSCSSELNAYISKCRVQSLSRSGDIYIMIKMQNGKVIGEYYEGGSLKDTKTLSDGRANVSYKIGDVTPHLAEGSSFKLSFNRSTGALNPQTVGGSDYCTAIYVTGATKTYTITIVPSTGKHSVS